MTPGALFVSPQYLQPLEQLGCATPETGWTAAPLTMAAGAAPCYRKSHSWGEFVFDFEFAAAYRDHGLRYYPKHVCCVPFTPVSGPRLLAPSDDARRELATALVERAAREKMSSVHVLFALPEEIELLRSLGWLPRAQMRYAWTSAGDASFEEFLARLSSKKRKNIRRERAAIAESGLSIEWCAGDALSDDEWSRVFSLYASTYQMRGQPPYLTPGCLRAWARNFGASMQLCLARRDGRISAMAFYFRDETTLYGRHWGSEVDVPGLHFELCYYRGIEYCIEHRLERFDAGVQGEHRLLRGFAPELSWSAHWFAHAGFRAAIGEALARETRLLIARVEALRDHTAYRES